MKQTSTVFYGSIVHSLSPQDLEHVSKAVIVVDNSTGVITRIEKDVDDLKHFLKNADLTEAKVHILHDEQFLMPGLVDTHAHAPQYMFAGSNMDHQLLEWLNAYVFPCEAAFKDTKHAAKAYTRVIQRFLANGTTTCSWFATIHLDACKVLVDTIDNLGQRAYVGKVNMDQNSPEYYIESTESSLKDTREFIEYVLGKKDTLVTPVVTPRFAISCTRELMNGLGELAKEYNLPIQTHLCENLEEIKLTKSIFKDSKDYTSVYDDSNLLNEKSYMAHCVHMTEDELTMLAERKTGVAHCANSNFSLHSGVCNVRRFLEKGIKVGLGTDVAGGFSPSMLDAVRSTFFASKTMKIMKQSEDYKYLSVPELFYLATLGGAKVLNLEQQIGNFVTGKSFDALWIDLKHGSVDLMGGETGTQKIEKFLFNGSDQNIRHVYVQGKRVAGRRQD
ncbi:guanine deaminase [Rhizopus microsporus var. microsporus]|uniref:Guanine deaminase n=2 Tax=Rhizopus microsporus TaxID=58291 RepID=A0A1X0RFZ7_RHIZD|nr:guanine deaminase [Rhizopus microsporus var. microsporus]